MVSSELCDVLYWVSEPAQLLHGLEHFIYTVRLIKLENEYGFKMMCVDWEKDEQNLLNLV